MSLASQHTVNIRVLVVLASISLLPNSSWKEQSRGGIINGFQLGIKLSSSSLRLSSAGVDQVALVEPFQPCRALLALDSEELQSVVLLFCHL